MAKKITISPETRFSPKREVLIKVSARHIHLSQKDLEVLFGKGYKLTKKQKLGQPGEFAAKETVTIQNQDKKISEVRIVGPLDPASQVELSITDCFKLGVKPMVRPSGKLKGTPGIVVIGPKGKFNLKEGVIVAARHIHISLEKAKELKVRNGQMISVKFKGVRSVTFHNVLIRIKESFKLSMHIDTDEGNAAGIIKKGIGEIITK